MGELYEITCPYVDRNCYDDCLAYITMTVTEHGVEMEKDMCLRLISEMERGG